ncbi:hypothetical protein [Streptomyces subrutilus]|uniref:hypothetical protein n=1 Tax=Streptomyces subrutilus TaxID=36818 RepID=UPI0009A040B3|nr:hypothetical protein [Streptomyces subrutilus]
MHPESSKGGRKLTAHALGMDVDLGRAQRPRRVAEFLRRAGQEDMDLSEDGPISWEGGVPEWWKRPDA